MNIPLLASIEHDHRTIIAYTSNASLNGLLLLADETIADDESITISIPLNDRDDHAVIHCAGTVVRHTDGGIGVHISTVDSNSFLQWRALLYSQPHQQARLSHDRQPAPLTTFFSRSQSRRAAARRSRAIAQSASSVRA